MAASPAASDTSDRERFVVPVSEFELEVLEGFPLQVAAVLEGDLPDACSTIESVEERFLPEERTYRLSVSAVRPAEALCAQVLTPFEVRVPIVEAGLATAEFAVAAGEIAVRFDIRPLGEFPGLDVLSVEETVWVCFVGPNLCFEPPADWRRDGLAPIWQGPDFLSSRLGGRFHPREPDGDPAALLPVGAEVHGTGPARLASAVGFRFAVRHETIWSEHLVAPCGADLWCELWLEAPSEPLLEAAGEAFWRLVRFAIRF